MFRNISVLLGIALFLLSSSPALAELVPIEKVLTTEAQTLQLPAFNDDEMVGIDFKKLFEQLPAMPGQQWPSDSTGSGLWSLLGSEEGQFLAETQPSSAAVQYLVFYVNSHQYQKATLKITCGAELAASMNGETVSLGEKDDSNVREAELVLPVGLHPVAVRVLLDPEKPESSALKIEIQTPDEAAANTLTVSTDRQHPVTIDSILNAPKVSSVSVSPDGQYTVLRLGEYADGKNHDRWLEIRTTQDLKPVQYLRGLGSPSSLSWHPGTGDNTALTWETSHDDRSTVWLFNLDSGETRAVLENVADLGRWQWAPDGQSIFYEISRSDEADSRRVKRVAHPADRQPWWRGRSHLMQGFLDGRLERQLTAGPLNPDSWQVAPDGQSLIFFTRENDWTSRPFHITKLWQLNLQNLQAEVLFEDSWVGSAIFSPDGETLCLTGSPSAFDGLGRKLPDGVQANDYGGQLYLMDLQDRNPRPVSLDFRPDVANAQWSQADGHIYARCTDTQHSNIYRYNVKKAKWTKVDTGVEYTNQISLPKNGRYAVARGTSANHPNTVQVLDLKKNKVKHTFNPGKDHYQSRGIVFGEVKTWGAKLANGETLDGMVYYPPGFDPEKTYPLIVYYYGGTSPVTRDFGGRYPKNVWAGQGYVVYVPNPSGATGYGQEMAARHVNDWGKITAGEVIEGTKAFLAAHEFAQAENVGCIGASYGGFLTQYIITQTDIFAAAVSHAGISSISSYWGEGMWGYAYGTRALANSYPWQDRELYVEQSPLFHADNIHTPLLLVHGDSDINVPVGESDQLFTALKILGRDVEYVQIQGQDHHILDHEQRIVWNDTILAYFARYLKDRSDWWDALYPAATEYR